jgi:Mg-chelatase subunit ChlD
VASSGIAQLISTLVATGRSNVAAALNEAVAELTNPASCRPDAEKVILLISDGKPDAPGGSSTAAKDCYSIAKKAAQQGIKIVAIDVATTTDANHAAFLQQVATLSNGYYISGSTQAQLNVALQKILSQLVALR